MVASDESLSAGFGSPAVPGLIEASRKSGPAGLFVRPALLKTRQGFQRIRRQKLSFFGPGRLSTLGGKEWQAKRGTSKQKRKEMETRTRK